MAGLFEHNAYLSVEISNLMQIELMFNHSALIFKV